MIQLEIVQGSDRDYPLQAQNEGSQSAPIFSSGDSLEGFVWPGGDQADLFNPTVTWYTAGGTQTGYDQGQVVLTIPAAQSATLTPNATYSLEIWWTKSDATRTACIVRGTLLCLPAPGTGASTVTPYCTLEDCLQRASWIRMIQSADTDQAEFYRQRLQARNWMDWAIVNSYRGASVGLFEQHSTLAFVFGGGVGWRRSLGPSPSLLTYLSQNMLIVRPQIVTATAYKAIAEIARGQVGVQNQWAAQAPYFDAMAEREIVGTTAEVDLNGDGIGELFINLGSCNPLMT